MSQLRIVPLGGAGEIGRNCTALIQGDDMLIVDVGLSFPNEEMLGVDIVIPDFTFILENKEKLKGIILTHGHEDHIGALPYLLPHVKCPVFATPFTNALIRMKLDDKMDVRTVDLQEVQFGDSVKAGSLKFEFIRITHSIPESSCVAIETQHGHVLFTGDFKFDFTPVDNKLTDVARLTQLGTEGVLCLLSDCTNVERPGWGPSESTVANGFREIFSTAPGRVLITTFASNIHRMQQAFEMAAETGRKVAVAGRRMDQTLDLCQRLNYVRIPRNTRIRLEDAKDHADNELVILTTGSQGEPMAALSQMSRREYSRMQVREGDTLIYSARPIPGNEAAIWRVINRLFRMGANVIYDHPNRIHVSGHGYQEEIKMMINLTKPFYLAPVHGEPRHQHIYRQMATAMGYPDHRIFTMTDGLPLEFSEESAWLGEEEASGIVLVDNGGNAGIPDDVIRDRHSLGSDGLVMVSVVIEGQKGKIVSGAQISSRGFSGDDLVLDKAANAIEDALESLSPAERTDIDGVRHLIADTARKFIHRRCQLRPLILPVVVEI